MKYALFLGCTIPARALNYEIAGRKVANALGIEFADVEDFACCGYPVEATSEETAELLAARNLAIASSMGLNICTLCSACGGILTKVNERFVNDKDFKSKTNLKLKQIGKEYQTNISVKHFTRILHEDVGTAKIKNYIKKPLNKLRLAAHYGCHYIKPSALFHKFDNPENPRSLDELLKVTGAEVINYENKKLCCTGSILGARSAITYSAAAAKLSVLKAAGADAMVSICPFCSVIYEDNQRNIEKQLNMSFNLPVLFFPQVLGLALGIDNRELGFRFQKIIIDDLLAKIDGPTQFPSPS